MEHLSMSGTESVPGHALPIAAVRDNASAEIRAWSTQISIHSFIQRLSLMADLELPCTIYLKDGSEDHCCHGIIRVCSLHDGRLSLRGDDFSLHLREEHIESVQLVHRRRSQESTTALEIYSTSGTLLASFVGTPDRQRAAIWQDIMDSLAVAVS